MDYIDIKTSNSDIPNNKDKLQSFFSVGCECRLSRPCDVLSFNRSSRNMRTIVAIHDSHPKQTKTEKKRLNARSDTTIVSHWSQLIKRQKYYFLAWKYHLYQVSEKFWTILNCNFFVSFGCIEVSFTALKAEFWGIVLLGYERTHSIHTKVIKRAFPKWNKCESTEKDNVFQKIFDSW